MSKARPFAASVMKVAANETMRMIVLQAHRARSHVAEDGLNFFDHELFRRDADHALFVLALWRLQEISRATLESLASTQSDARGRLEAAHAAFRNAVPNFEMMRHLVVHVADYAAGDGRDQTVHPGLLYSGEFFDGVRARGGRAVDVDAAIEVSEQLYAAIVQALDSSAMRQATAAS